MSSMLEGGHYDVISLVGLDKGRQEARGFVKITAAKPEVVGSPDDARLLAQNLLDGANAAERDAVNAQRLIDKGELNIDDHIKDEEGE